MTVYRVKDWARLFEKAQSRFVRNARWVAVPNSFDGRGFRQLLRRDDGVAVYGAWVLILEVASKCPVRGVLLRGGEALSPADLALMTGGQTELFAKALEVLTLPEIGWLEVLPADGALPGTDGPLQRTDDALQRTDDTLQCAATTGQDITGQDKTDTEARTPAGPTPRTATALPLTPSCTKRGNEPSGDSERETAVVAPPPTLVVQASSPARPSCTAEGGGATQDPIPADLDGAAEAIREWLAYKRQKGQGYRNKGLAAFWGRCRELGVEGLAAAVRHSMANNYAGLFPPKEGLDGQRLYPAGAAEPGRVRTPGKYEGLGLHTVNADPQRDPGNG